MALTVKSFSLLFLLYGAVSALAQTPTATPTPTPSPTPTATPHPEVSAGWVTTFKGNVRTKYGLYFNADAGTTSTLVQSGLSRNSATTETFNFSNPGAGCMKLLVDGTTVTVVTDLAAYEPALPLTDTVQQMLQSRINDTPVWSTTTWPATAGTSGKVLISDGTNIISSTSTLPSSAGATANKFLKSDGTNYVLSTTTWPDASATAGKIIRSGGTNWAASTATYPDSVTAAGQAIIASGENVFAVSTAVYPSVPGNSGTLLASNGTGFTNTTATYPGTATGTGTILRADGTNWAATTATYPATTTINQLLYSSAANVIGGLTSVNSAMLITDSAGRPYWVTYADAKTTLGLATTSTPQFAGLTITGGGAIKPSADSTTALNIANAAGTPQIYYDSTNMRMGFGKSTPGVTLVLGGSDPSFALREEDDGFDAVTIGSSTAQGTLAINTSGVACVSFQGYSHSYIKPAAAAGYFGVGIVTPTTLIHADKGNATAAYLKFTAGTTTGQTATDGFDLGIDASGNAELRQRENLPIYVYTNNTLAATFPAAGGLTLASPGILGGDQVSIVYTLNASTQIVTGPNTAWFKLNDLQCSAAKGYQCVKAGSVIGIAVRYDVTSTALPVGGLAFHVAKNGASVWSNAMALCATVADDKKETPVTQARGTDVFAAGDTLGVYFYNNSVDAITVNECEATLLIIYN